MANPTNHPRLTQIRKVLGYHLLVVIYEEKNYNLERHSISQLIKLDRALEIGAFYCEFLLRKIE